MSKKPTAVDIENIESKILEDYSTEYFDIIKDFYNIYEQNIPNKDPNRTVCVDNEMNYDSLNKKISRANNLYNMIYEISPDRDKFQMTENQVINTLNDARALYLRKTTGKPSYLNDSYERITPGDLIEKMEYFRDALKGKKSGEYIDTKMLEDINKSVYTPKFHKKLKDIISKIFK
jgi:hypothetical protein